ncbi:MAG: hypothetical protein ACXVPR_09555 [Actinomycetota bacterium]
MFRRLPEGLRPALEGFRAVVEHIERAKGSLTDAVPTTRLPGRPLAEALLEFEDELAAAEAERPRGRTPELGEAGLACERAIAEARSSAEELRLAANAPVGFEALIGTIGDLLAPLDAFGEAADRFRDLRRRR